MDYDLDGWVVLVSGAASGIGRATAEVLAGMGAWIVAADTDADAGEAAAAALRDGGAEVRFVTADVADEDAGARCGGGRDRRLRPFRRRRELRRRRRGSRGDARLSHRRLGQDRRHQPTRHLACDAGRDPRDPRAR